MVYSEELSRGRLRCFPGSTAAFTQCLIFYLRISNLNVQKIFYAWGRTNNLQSGSCPLCSFGKTPHWNSVWKKGMRIVTLWQESLRKRIYLVFIRRFYKEFISLSHYFEVPLNKNDVARDFFDECIYPKKF